MDLHRNRQELMVWKKFFQSEGHVLLSHPRLLFQQAANQPDVTAVARKAVDHLSGEGGRPWLRWVNKPTTLSPCIRTILGNRGPVYTCKISPDGNRLYSAGGDGTIRVWSFPGGRELKCIEAHDEGVNGLALSQDESRLVSWSDEGEIALWDLKSGGLVSREIEGGDIVSCEFLPFGKRYRTFNRMTRKVGLRASSSGKLLVSVTGLVASTPDGKLLIVADPEGCFNLLDTETGRRLNTVPQMLGIQSPFGISPNGERLFFSYENETVAPPGTLFDLEVTAFRSEMKHPYGGVFSPGGGRVAVPDDFSLVLFDGVTGSQIATCTGHTDIVVDCVFSPRGNRFVSASLDSTLRIWDALDGQLLAILRGHQGEIRSVAYSPDGRTIVSSSVDGSIRTWYADAVGDHAAPSHSASVRVCRFHPDGRTVLTAGDDGLFKLWDGRTGEELGRFEAHCPSPDQFDSLPSGDHFVSVGETYDTVPVVREWVTGTVVRELHGLPEEAECITPCVVSPNGLWVLAGSEDGTVKAWGPWPDSDPLSISESVNSAPGEAGFSEHSDFAAVCFDDGPLRILKLPSWEPWAEFSALDGKGISSFCFLPGSSLVVGASQSGVLHVWDYLKKDLLGPTFTRQAGLSGFSTSPDGRHLLARCRNGIMVWPIPVYGEEIKSGELLSAHGITSYAVSPDGVWLAGVSEKGWLIVWDIHSGRVVTEMPLPGSGRHVSWSPLGDRICVAVGDGGIIYEGGQSAVAYMLLVDPQNLRFCCNNSQIST